MADLNEIKDLQFSYVQKPISSTWVNINIFWQFYCELSHSSKSNKFLCAFETFEHSTICKNSMSPAKTTFSIK